MSRKGGYIIFDLKGKPFTSGTPVSIDGAYAVASNPYGKVTLVSGLVVGTAEYPDFYAPFVEGESAYVSEGVINGNTISISVDENDNVTVTVTEPTP